MQKTFIAILFGVCLLGCPLSKVAEKETPAPAVKAPRKPKGPEITIQFAALDLSRTAKKIGKADIDEFAGLLRHEKIDILTLDGITRYPGLSSRADIIDELSREAGMRQVFGETINLSGKQGGNAVLSNFPIRSNENTHYNGLQSSSFEAALQAIIDCGVRDVVVVSTHIPDKASLTDQTVAANLLGEFPTLYINHPVIVAGNLPSSGGLSGMESYDEVEQFKGGDSPHVWFSMDGSLSLLHARTEKTIFGRLVIAEFGIFRQTSP